MVTTPITRFAINVAAIAIAAYIIPGVIIDGLLAAVVTAIVLGAINTFVRPILILLTLPATIITLGLFIIVINAGLILLVSKIVPGFFILNFWWAILFSFVVALLNGFLMQIDSE